MEFNWDSEVMRVAEYLATDEGKSHYRTLYKGATSSWLSCSDLTRSEALSTARADSLVSIITYLGIDDQELDKDLCSSNDVDSRLWARSKSPEKIAEGLKKIINQPV